MGKVLSCVSHCRAWLSPLWNLESLCKLTIIIVILLLLLIIIITVIVRTLVIVAAASAVNVPDIQAISLYPVSNSPLTRPWRVKLVTLYRQLDKTTFTYISTNRTLSRVEYAFTVPMLFVVVVVVVVFVFDCQVDVDVDNVQRPELVNVYRV